MCSLDYAQLLDRIILYAIIFLFRLILFITNEMRCSVQFVLRPPAADPEEERRKGQRGPWSQGMIALADLLLLSQAQYFIGTRESTFSLLMAYNVAAQSTIRKTTIAGYVSPTATIDSSSNPLHQQLLWIRGGVGCEIDSTLKNLTMDCLNYIHANSGKLPYYDYDDLVCTN
jgi:hypothetical protein